MAATPRALFVTGTDTGVGKTLVAAGLVAAWRRRGVDAIGFKPVETGVPGLAAGARWPAAGAVPADGVWLAAASGWTVPLTEVVAEAFAAPLAPAVAAEEAGVSLEPSALRRAFEQLHQRHELVVVEGAGGLAVELARGYETAAFARDLALPLLVVCRPNLGTLNHTVLTTRYAESQGIAPLGLVINGAPPPEATQEYAADPSLASNARELPRLTGWPLLGTVPRQAPPPATPAAAADLVEAHLDLARLDKALQCT